MKESDNNVKLIVLDRLLALRDVPSQEKILQELAMDVLRILATPDLEVRRKTLNLGVELVTGRTVNEMVEVLKKEVGKTHNTGEHEDTGKYRQLLVRTLHSISIKFPDVAGTIIPVLMEFLSDTNEMAATDVLVFVREAIQRFPELRTQIIERLLSAVPTIRSMTVHRHTLWILGEYATTVDEITGVVGSIRTSLGELPIVESILRTRAGEEGSDENGPVPQQQMPSQHRVTADGTYATQSAFSTGGTGGTGSTDMDASTPLRKYLKNGNFYIGSVIANTLVKMAFRYFDLVKDKATQNRFSGEAMLIISSIVHLGKSDLASKPMTEDDYDRMMICLHVINERSQLLSQVFTSKCREALSHMLTVKAEEEEEANKKKKSKDGGDGVVEHVDDHISFPNLTKSSHLSATDDIFDLAMSKAVSGVKKETMDLSNSKLSKVRRKYPLCY